MTLGEFFSREVALQYGWYAATLTFIVCMVLIFLSKDGFTGRKPDEDFFAVMFSFFGSVFMYLFWNLGLAIIGVGLSLAVVYKALVYVKVKVLNKKPSEEPDASVRDLIQMRMYGKITRPINHLSEEEGRP